MERLVGRDTMTTYLTPDYSYVQRRYRIVGIETDHTAPRDEAHRVQDVAERALNALLLKVGKVYSLELNGRRTTITVQDVSADTPSEPIALTTPALGRYRVIGLQKLSEPCAFCSRTASVKWGGKWACTEHADHEGVVWDAVRRTRAAAQEALGDNYKVSIKLNIDPRVSYRHHQPTGEQA